MPEISQPGPSVHTVPEGDDRPRLTCLDCGYIAYENPKIIVGSVCVWKQKFLLCRRAIEPRKGYWTFPAGYLELNETTADGAEREAKEEASAHVKVTGLLGIYEIPRISQVYVIYKAEMENCVYAAGPESAEVQLLKWSDIPWDELAFPSVAWGLTRFREGGEPVMYQHPDI